MAKLLPRIAITMGDPAGVGPELCLRLLASPEIESLAQIIVFGDVQTLEAVARQCRLPLPEQVIPGPAWDEAFEHLDRSCILDLGRPHAEPFREGKISAACGAASYSYLEKAIHAALAGQIAAITTAPINKESLHLAGIPFPGHTEILQSITGADRVCMMLTSDEITCSLVTAHVGLGDVARLLSPELVQNAIELTADSMRRMRGREPKLVVCGLNPHSGESGLFGAREEERFITPAIEAARAAGVTIEGPIPADTAFLLERRRNTDAYICMYHDQGLIPLKMLAFDNAVNVTLGLPIIRTSVDHGTAFDIAWKGIASPNSLIAATRLAAKMASS